MRELFAHIAARYDRMNRIMSLALDRRWRRLALNAATLPPTGAVLDLACGTGDFTVEVRLRCPKAAIIGIDLTPEMLEIARAKTSRMSGIRFQTGDAQDLAELPDGTFGLIICAFGFRNFPDKSKALAECRRVLAPDGELVVLELFHPVSRILGFLVNIWLAVIAFLFARDTPTEYAYLRRSVSDTISADAFAGLAEEAGFSLHSRRFFLPAATCMVFKCATSRPDDRTGLINDRKAPSEPQGIVGRKAI